MSAFDDVLREIAHAPALAPVDPLVGTTLAHYRIVSRIGSGATGVVYRAVDDRLRRAVAVKVLRGESGGDYGRIVAEAQAAALVQHPNVAAIYDVGMVGSIAFVVMELVEGVLLSERIRAARLRWREATAIVRAVASGLVAAHARGLVHGDVKPDNIAIDRDGRPKLLDFGAASPAGHPPLRARGAKAYASPEQWRGDAIDPRADVYSLGRLLEAITKPPLPRKLGPIVRRACAANPGDRFPDAASFERALARTTRRGARLGWIVAAALALVCAVTVAIVWGATPPRAVERKQASAAPVTVSDESAVSTESAALSPDGTLLAFAEDRGVVLFDLGTRRTRGLWLDRRKIFTSIRFDRDGSHLLVSDTHDLFLVDVHTGARRALGIEGGGSAVAIDESRFFVYGDRGFVLYDLVDPTNARLLVARAAGEAFFPFDVSPDRTRVVFVRRGGGADRVETFEIDQPRPRKLELASRLCADGPVTLAFAADDRLLVASASPGFKVYALGGAGFEQQLGVVARGERAISNLRAAGGRIAMQLWRARTHAFVAHGGRLDDAERASLSDRDETPSAFTHDGGALWVTERNGESRTCVRVDLGDRTAHTPLGDERCEQPFELADGTLLRWGVASGRDAFFRGSRELFVVPETGTERAQTVRCTPDERCFVADLRAGAIHAVHDSRLIELARVDAGGGEFVDFAVARSGDRFALAQRFSSRLWIVRPADSPQLIDVRGCELSGVEEDGDAWLVTAFCAARPRYRVFRVGENLEERAWGGDRAEVFAPVRSPDGQSLAFARTDYETDLVVLDAPP